MGERLPPDIKAEGDLPLVLSTTAMAPEAGRTEGDMAGRSPGIVVVVERISRGSPVWGEPPLQWMAP